MNKLYENLKDWFKNFDYVVVAYSGGVDSALVLKAATDSLTTEKVIAITADSPSIPRKELQLAIEFAKEIKANHKIVKTNELDDELYRNNTGDRCFHCKKTLYQSIHNVLITEVKKSLQLNSYIIVDGTNVDDLSDLRPGLLAAKEAGILHPLVESGLNKQSVRDISKELGIKIWNKPAMACLASRITIGNKVNAEKLSQVEAAEEILEQLGLKIFRVRYHELNNNNDKPSILARIEVDKSEISSLTTSDVRQKIISTFREIGFDYITIDIEGYKTNKGGLEAQEF